MRLGANHDGPPMQGRPAIDRPNPTKGRPAMSITREQVAELRAGDVVEYRRDDWPEGCYVRSPLNGDEYHGGLYVLDGHFGVRTPDGRPYECMASLAVVSRAPRPLYVNHDRTEPVAGDVVRDAKGVIRQCGPLGDEPGAFWSYDYEPGWRWTWTATPPEPLTLLVDGETGQVVP